MSKQQIRHIIEQHSQRDGLTETGIAEAVRQTIARKK